MSVEAYCRSLPNLPIGRNDRKWFPKWIRRYASALRKGRKQSLPVEEATVIDFLKSLRDNGVPAWQRLQAARAVEAYRQHILGTSELSLVMIKQTLQRLAARERDSGGIATNGDDRYGSALEGKLRHDEPEVLRQLRSELRRLGNKYDTEKAIG